QMETDIFLIPSHTSTKKSLIPFQMLLADSAIAFQISARSSLISSQLLYTYIPAATNAVMAAIAMPIGLDNKAMAFPTDPNKGNNDPIDFANDPNTTNTGPTAATIPATMVIVFWILGDRSANHFTSLITTSLNFCNTGNTFASIAGIKVSVNTGISLVPIW